ncbi:MAG TPA: hypothetical protein VHR88_04710, partial [Solirubrobacteraceae bacterium]|nr:hypothetical protein [Solirubrobacteraceae bacterium]
VRTNVSPTNDMELLAQDRVLPNAGTTANPATSTGANTPWLAATLILKAAAPVSGAALARSTTVGGTPVAADAPNAPADPLIYAFSAVAPVNAKRDASSLLFCPLGQPTNPNAQLLRGPIYQTRTAKHARTPERRTGRRRSRTEVKSHRRAHTPGRARGGSVAARDAPDAAARRLRARRRT